MRIRTAHNGHRYVNNESDAEHLAERAERLDGEIVGHTVELWMDMQDLAWIVKAEVELIVGEREYEEEITVPVVWEGLLHEGTDGHLAEVWALVEAHIMGLSLAAVRAQTEPT